jgi:predicted MFS family arabinose efflux permease
MQALHQYFSAYKGLSKPIWFLAIILFINRCGSMVLLFSSLYMINELHFSQAQSGLVMSCYGIGSIAGSYMGGWLSDRYNVLNIMSLSLFVSGILLFSILWIATPFWLGALLFGYACISDTFRPANAVAVKKCSSPDNITRSFSLVRMAINLGFTVAPAVGGYLAIKYSYHSLFVIDAFTSIIASFVLILFLKKLGTNNVSKEINHIEVKKSKSAYQDIPFLFFILFVSLYGLCFFQLIASVPTFFQRQWQYSPEKIGWLLALNGLMVVLIEMPLIAFLEKKQTPSKFIFIGNICTAIAFCILLFNLSNIFMATLFILIISMSEMFAMPFMMSFVTSRPLPERQGQYSALYSMAYAISFICAPLLGLTLSEKIGFSYTYSIVACLSVIVGFGFKWAMKK